MGRALTSEYVKYWVLGWVLAGYRYSPPDPPTGIPTPGTPPPTPACPVPVLSAHRGQLQCAVGLRSVDQLSLCAEISGFRGITEVYNLRIAGIINNHLHIPGNE